MERNITPDYKTRFKDSLHMIYQWRLNVYVTVKYLINIDAPVVNCKMHYKTDTSTNTNCALTECSHQKL